MIPSALKAELADRPGGVFYLHGEDEYAKEAAAEELARIHLAPDTRDFNYDPLRGSELDPETLASTLGTPPMMAEWRVVRIRETQALAASPRARDLVLGAAGAPPPGLVLILLCTKPQGSKAKFYTTLERSARSLAFNVPGPNDLPAWLVDSARDRLGRELEESAARGLAQAIGGEVSLLMRELEKLDTLVDEGEPITLDAVRAAGTRIPRQDRWHWFDLVGERRFAEALSGLPVLFAHGETGVGLTIGLATHLLRLGVALDGGADALRASLPGRQGWVAGKLAKQARGWDPRALEDALEGLLLLDRHLKSSALPDQHLVESWLLERAAGSEAVAG